MVNDPARSFVPRPRGVLLIAAVLLLEAVGVALLAVGFLRTLLGAEPLSVGSSVFMVALLILLAVALVTLARKLAAGFRWPRSPTLVVQMFLVILAFPYFDAGNPLYGFLLLVPAAAVIVTLFSRPVVLFTARTTDGNRAL